MSETWEGEKSCLHVADDVPTPMIRLQYGRTFYVNEVVQRTHGRWFIPQRWILMDHDVMYADGLHVLQTQVACLSTFVAHDRNLMLASMVGWFSSRT